MNTQQQQASFEECQTVTTDESESEVGAQHALCEQWVGWLHTRRHYGAPSLPPSLLGRWVKSKTRPLPPAAFDVPCDPYLHALNLAISAQPMALDRQVFEAHYLVRVKNIKSAADALGVSRRHWYTLLTAFRRRVHAAAAQLVAQAEAEKARMQSIRNTTR